MSTSRWILASALAASAVTSVSLASKEARAQWDPPVHRSDAGADLYLWSARYDGTDLAAVPFVQFEPTPNLFINLRFPVSLQFSGPDDRSHAALGNPTVGIYYSDQGRRLTWYAGGHISAPLGLVDSNGWRLAEGAAAAAMAFYDGYLWALDTLPFGGMGGIEYRFTHWFVLRAGGDLTFFPQLGDRYRYRGFYRSGDFDVDFQAKVEAEFQSRVGVGGGVALMTTWVPTYDGDNAQASLMPYFVYDSQKTFFMRVGALLALDEPLGPAFDRGKVASVYLQLGGHID